jgi:hypothetical protein
MVRPADQDQGDAEDPRRRHGSPHGDRHHVHRDLRRPGVTVTLVRRSYRDLGNHDRPGDHEFHLADANSGQIGYQAVIIGATMARLLAARVLADSPGEVTAIDRDELPEASPHPRGAPQR